MITETEITSGLRPQKNGQTAWSSCMNILCTDLGDIPENYVKKSLS